MKYLNIIKEYPIHWALGGKAHVSLEQNPEELVEFSEWIEKNNIKTVLEIGTSYGYLGKYLTEVLGCTVDGVTIDKGQVIFEGYNKLIEGNSCDPKTVNKTGTYDLIFVDGDHQHPEKDYQAYKGKCKYIAFHDILGLRDCHPVKLFWMKHKGIEFINSDHNIASGIGIIKNEVKRGRPKKNAKA